MEKWICWKCVSNSYCLNETPLINGKGRKGFTLLGHESSCANITVQQHTRFTKTAARHPARKKKNLPRQWPVIFTQGDSWMAHSQLQRAPQTSGQGPMFSLLLMQNRWEGLFGHFVVAVEDWNALRSVASWSVKTFKRWCDLKIQMRKVHFRAGVAARQTSAYKETASQ